MVGRVDAKDWAKENFPRLWAIQWTPFTPAGEIDWPALRAHVKHLASLKIDAIDVAGIVAECQHLTIAERKKLAEVVMDELGGRFTTIFSCTSDSPRETLELARFAGDVGADLAFIWVPHDYAATDEMMHRFYQYIDEGSDIAVCLHSTRHSGREMSERTISQLADLPSSCAIKLAPGNDAVFAAAKTAVGDRLKFAFSHERNWLSSMFNGNDAIMTTALNLLQTPDFAPIHDYTRLALEGRVEEAQAVRDALEPLRKLWDDTFVVYRTENRHPIQETKIWLHALGAIESFNVRAPQGPASPELAARVREAPMVLRGIREDLSRVRRVA